MLYRLAFIIPFWGLVSMAGAQDPTVNPANVFLGTSANYAILSKAGVSTVPNSVITGHVGVSPIAGDALTGFSLMISDSSFATSLQITGKAYAANYDGVTPAMLTTAITDMETAYTDAASRSNSGEDYLNIGEGILNGDILTQGVYTWGSDISLSDIVYITGGPDDVFIFQSSGNVIVGSNTMIVLQGGVKASNIVWQVAGYVQAGTNSHLEGIFLVKTNAVFQTGASLNGRILAQTAVTLDSATITQPLPDFQGQLHPFIPIGLSSDFLIGLPSEAAGGIPVDAPGPIPTPVDAPGPILTSSPVEAPGPIPTPVDAPGSIPTSLPIEAPDPIPLTALVVATDPNPTSVPVYVTIPILPMPIGIPVDAADPVPISPPVDAPDSIIFGPTVDGPDAVPIGPLVDAYAPIPISPSVDDPDAVAADTPFDESNPIHTNYPVDGSNTAAINERRRWGTGGSFNGPLHLTW
jgi:hypothetical protein